MPPHLHPGVWWSVAIPSFLCYFSIYSREAESGCCQPFVREMKSGVRGRWDGRLGCIIDTDREQSALISSALVSSSLTAWDKGEWQKRRKDGGECRMCRGICGKPCTVCEDCLKTKSLVSSGKKTTCISISPCLKYDSRLHIKGAANISRNKASQ